MYAASWNERGRIIVVTTLWVRRVRNTVNDVGRVMTDLGFRSEGRISKLSISLVGRRPDVHTNDFAPIYVRRGPKLGYASLATVFRPSRLIFQPILRENLEATVVRYQPITTAVIPDACLITRWHNGALYHRKKTHCGSLERVARSGSCRESVRGSVGAMYAELS